jgi:HEPN domain-containing protein
VSSPPIDREVLGEMLAKAAQKMESAKLSLDAGHYDDAAWLLEECRKLIDAGDTPHRK